MLADAARRSTRYGRKRSSPLHSCTTGNGSTGARSGCSRTCVARCPATGCSGSRPPRSGCVPDGPPWRELILSHGFHRLQADERPRMLGEDAIWHLKRGATRVALGQTDEARIDLLRAARGGATAWVTGQAYLELGKAFDLKGNHQQARGHYVRSRRLCGEGGDRRCARARRHVRHAAVHRSRLTEPKAEVGSGTVNRPKHVTY